MQIIIFPTISKMVLSIVTKSFYEDLVKKVNNTSLLKQNITLNQNVYPQTARIKIKSIIMVFVLLCQNVVNTKVLSYHQKNILKQHVRMDLEKEAILLEVQHLVYQEERRIPRATVEKYSEQTKDN